MSDQETLHFKIGLSRSSTKKQPKFKIYVNNTELVCAELTGAAHTTEYFEFDAAVDEGDCHLAIEFLNKSVHDTVLDVNGNIIEDLLLNIESIEIDDIDLGQLIWSNSEFVATDPNRPTLKNCVNLGWNGSYQLKFNSPFYLWLLENM